MADISETLVSNSTQLDNVDLMSGPRDFTITAVHLTASEQPLSITLQEYERPWKPGLTMRRLLSEMWGAESDAWIGRRVRLYRDESVTFGKDKTGGTRISHASQLDKPITATLPTSKGKFGEFKVKPLGDAPAAPSPPTEPTAEAVSECENPATLRDWWRSSGAERRSQIETRVAELTASNEGGDENPQWTDTPDTLPTDGGDDA